MDFVYRKAESSDSPRIAELFEEMLRTIYHTNDVKGYEDGYLDRFFSGGDDLIGTKLISLAENYSESIGIPAIVLHVEKTNEGAYQLYRKLGYRDHEDQGNRILMVKELRK